MGYLNPVLQYGVEEFCKKARDAGVSGVILPDLPMHEYTSQYKKLFRDYDLHFIFLITPSTKEDRIREIDRESTAFIYAVSAASTTGSASKMVDGKKSLRI
jgi:tryptophan synthase alpha chain